VGHVQGTSSGTSAHVLDDTFSYSNDGQKTLSNPKVEIPLRLDTSLYCTTQGAETSYHLLGGILHVSEIGSIEEEGHYVTVLKRTTRNRRHISQNKWAMIDDEICTFVTEMEVLEMAFGTMDAQGRYSCATLLVYGPADDNEDHVARDELDQLFVQFKGEISERAMIEPSPLSKQTNDDVLNEQAVGQRLRVQWAKGRLYAGTVVSYDPSTRKHRVQYDDGDIREYNLAKKTIKWETADKL
jgi:Ubiquitin carboxyl-terminal hydrolase